MRAIALAVLILLVGCASASYRTRVVERVRNGGDLGAEVRLMRDAPFARGLEEGDCAAIYRSTMSAVDFTIVSSEAIVAVVEPVASNDGRVDRGATDADDAASDADAETDQSGRGGATDASSRDASTDRSGLRSDTAGAGAGSATDRSGRSSESAAGSGGSATDAASRDSVSARGYRGAGADAASRDSGSDAASSGADSDAASRDAASASGSRSGETAEAGSGGDTKAASSGTFTDRARGTGGMSSSGVSSTAGAARGEGRMIASGREVFADRPLLEVVKTAFPSEAFYGDEVVFRLRIRNVSRLEIEAIQVVDHLDAWFELEDLDEADEIEVERVAGGNSTRLVFEIPEVLEPGQTWTVMITTKVRMPPGRE